MAGFSFTPLGTPPAPGLGRFGGQSVLKAPKPPQGTSMRFGGGPRQIGAGQRTLGAQGPGAAPPSLATAPSQGQGAPGASGLDSTYYANTAQNAFNVGNQVNAINLRDAIAGTNLESALGQLAFTQPRDELKLEQGANQRGALYSSVYSQNLGDLNKGYADKQAGLQNAYASQLAQDASQIEALQGGIPLYNDQQAAGSASRASALAARNPASGEQALAQALAQALKPKGVGNLYGKGPSSTYRKG